MTTSAMVASSELTRPVSPLRRAFKLTAIGVWSFWSGAGALPSVLLGFAPTWQTRWRRAMTRAWTWGLARVLGMRVTVRGPVPEPPFLLVSNHVSYLDIILLGSVTGCSFLSRHDVREWPGLGLLARIGGTLFVNRGNRRDALRAMDEMRHLVEHGTALTFFPEGTSTRGDRVYPLKSTLFAMPAELGLPVHTAAVRYETDAGMPPADQIVCWWGDMTFGGHIMELCRWPGFSAEIDFGEETVQHEDRKELARLAHTAISSRFTPVVTGDT